MTAIAIAFDCDAERFVAAADGRCAVLANSFQIKSDIEQKIFPFQNDRVNVAYALTGMAQIGTFQIVPEIAKQVAVLSKRTFANGTEYTNKVFSNVAKVLERAIRDGRIPDIPKRPDLPTAEHWKVFTMFVLGYFRARRFCNQGDVYYEDKGRRFRVESYPKQLVQNMLFHTGSDLIGRMVFDPRASIDPRLAAFKNDPENPADALAVTTNFIKACCHPAASEIDSWCQIIGGHIHAAELTVGGFKWLIRPATSCAN